MPWGHRSDDMRDPPWGYRRLNRERGILIDKQIAGTLADGELERLEALNRYVDAYIEVVTPRRFDRRPPGEPSMGCGSMVLRMVFCTLAACLIVWIWRAL